MTDTEMGRLLDVVFALEAVGVRRVVPENDNLRLTPTVAIPPDLLAQVKADKAALLAALRPIYEPTAELKWIDPDEDAAPRPCPTCGGSDLWETIAGNWRCQNCEAAVLARSRELAKKAARLRERKTGASSRAPAPTREHLQATGNRPASPAQCPHSDIEETPTFDGYINRLCRTCGMDLPCRKPDKTAT